MGHHFPAQLAYNLSRNGHIETFVETGTYKGDTTRRAASIFEHVFTIEGDPHRYKKTLSTFMEYPNIVPLLGNSRIALYSLLKQINEPVIFWLDAHWCGGSAIEVSSANGDECPLLDELAAIQHHNLAHEHIILIDDARLFQNPPPYPHDPAQWPTMQQIGAFLPPDHLRVVKDDIIVSVPRELGEWVNRSWFDG